MKYFDVMFHVCTFHRIGCFHSVKCLVGVHFIELAAFIRWNIFDVIKHYFRWTVISVLVVYDHFSLDIKTANDRIFGIFYSIQKTSLVWLLISTNYWVLILEVDPWNESSSQWDLFVWLVRCFSHLRQLSSRQCTLSSASSVYLQRIKSRSKDPVMV